MRIGRRLIQISLVAAAVIAVNFVSPKALAVTGADFNPGRIMDDSVFFNKDAMSAAEIQAFLQSKVPVCDTYHVPPSGIADNRPWTCLYQYYENTTTHVNNIGAPTTIPAGAISGAQIIYNAAQTYNISPKVLLVLLQKEQSLITDSWPYPSQYRGATGYGCPDTSVCDSQYYGFYNQVTNAARQFRLYANNPGGYNYAAGRNNNILYNPNAACGYQTVFIQNQATAGLYNYTPYVPNAAALNNLYGLGDSCSAYGNRNFWRLYNDWFGSTVGVAYSATFAGQSDYPDIAPGASASAYIQYKNTGNSAWYDDTSKPTGALPTHLSTNNPVNRVSDFGSSWGPGKNRPGLNFSVVYESDGVTLSSNQHVVQPGQIGRFGFNFNVPSGKAFGNYREYFRPVLEGSSDGAFTYDNVWIDVTVSGVYGATYYSKGSAVEVRPTEQKTSQVSYKNTGSMPWYDDLGVFASPAGTLPVHLATSHLVNRSSVFSASWATSNRPGLVFSSVYESNGTSLAGNQHVVQPGQIGVYNIPFKTIPMQAAATYQEYFQPVVEGTSNGTFSDTNTYIDASVTSGIAGQYMQLPQSFNMVPGSTATKVVSFKNIGNTTWTRSTVYLKPDGTVNTVKFKGSNWASSSNAALLNESSVAPGSIGTFNVVLLAPAQPGAYTISFAPGNDSDSYAAPNAVFNISVQNPVYKASYAGQSDYPFILKGGSSDAFVKYRNTGNVAWYDDSSDDTGPVGTLPTHLATNNPINRASVFGSSWNGRNRPALTFTSVYESDGVTLAGDQHVVQPGQIGKFSFTFNVAINQPNGTYREYFRPVLEGSSDGAFTYDNVWIDVVIQ